MIVIQSIMKDNKKNIPYLYFRYYRGLTIYFLPYFLKAAIN